MRRVPRPRAFMIACLLALVPCAPLLATIKYVDAGAPTSPPPNGNSWGTAYVNLQTALSAAVADPSVTEIRLSIDPFSPDVGSHTSSATFAPRSNLTIRGGYAGAHWVANNSGYSLGDRPDVFFTVYPPPFSYMYNNLTIIGDYGTLTHAHVVTLNGKTGITFDRLWISFDATPVTDPDHDFGSGIRAVNSSFVLHDVVLAGGENRYGGGGIYSNNCSFSLQGCNVSGGTEGNGGGLYVDNNVSGLTMLITGNEQHTPVGYCGDGLCNRCCFASGASGSGGGVYLNTVSGSPLRISFARFNENTAGTGNSSGNGGGICVNSGEAIVSNSSFDYNFADDSRGGGVYVAAGASARLVNCTFAEGYAGLGGAAVWTSGTTSIVNSTVLGCRAGDPHGSDSEGGGVYVGGGSCAVLNSVLWANRRVSSLAYVRDLDAQIFAGAGSVTVHNTDTDGGPFSDTPSTNLSSDPQILATAYPWDLRIPSSSPCVNSGNNSYLPADELDLDEDSDTSEPTPLDAAKGPRVVGANVDMGAYENACPCPCSDDFNGDGDVGTDADIEAFFACLSGNCCPTCRSVDVDCDGDVATDADIEEFFRQLGGNHANCC